MVVAVAMDPLVEEEAEGLVNPRPSTQRFSSLAARTAEHDRLFKAGLYANRDGDVGLALAHFTVAYSLLFKRATLLALVNMLLKKGDCELAVACYRKMVASESVTPAERVRLMTKLHEAVVQWAALREVVEASQAGLLNSQEEREKRASKLMEKAQAANEARDFAAAEALFLEAWRLTFRKTTLISAANMMARQEARYRLAAGIYFWMRRRELTDDERMMVERKLKEVQVSLSVYWNRDGAARTVQRLFRGKHGRLLAVVQKKAQEAKQAYPARSPPSGCSSATSHSAKGLSRFWPGRSTAPNVTSHWSDDEEMGTGGAPNQKKPFLQESSDDEELATDAPRRNERSRHEPTLPMLLPRKSTGDSSSRSAGESFVTANPERVLRARKANEQKRMGGEEDPPSPPARHHTDGVASPERPAIPASQSGSTPRVNPHEAAIKSVAAPRAAPSSASSHHPQRDLSEKGKLKVHLVRGSGLLAADKNGFSDPYVVAKLGKATKKSKVIKKTLNPEWNETLEFGGVSLSDLIETSLSLHVWDYDGMASRADDMGEVNVSLAWLAQEDAYEATERLNTKGRLEFRLSWEAIDGRTSKCEGGMSRQSSRQSEPGRTQTAVFSPADGRVNAAVPSSGGGRSHAAVASSPVARVELTTPATSGAGAASSQQSVQRSPSAARLSERGSLKVHLVRGSGLMAADKNGFSDPYVVAKLGKATKKSKVIKKTLNPEWNETLEFGGVSLSDLIETSLSLHVWDYDGMASRADDMGEVNVSLAWLAQEDAYEATERLNTKGRLEFRLSWEAIDGRTSKSEGVMARQSSKQSDHGPVRTAVPSPGGEQAHTAVFSPADGRVNAAVPSSGGGRAHAAVASSPRGKGDLMVPATSGAGAASSQQSVQRSPSAARLSERGSLKVHLVRGSGLLAADKNGFSDPYVVAKLGKATKKSKVIKKTLNPEWNETLEFGGVSLSDLIETSLSLHVWDYDGMASRADDMGEVNVSLAWLAQEDAYEATERLNTKGRLEFRLSWEAIDGRTSKSEGGMSRQSSKQSEPGRTQTAVFSPADGRVNAAVPSSGGGRSHAAVASSPVAREALVAPAGAASSQQSVQRSPSAARLSEQGSLKVHLVRGSGLMAADKNGFSDPYVVAKLGKATKKSKVIRKTLNPEWNETFEFGGVSLGDLIETSLSLHVWDYDGMMSRADDMGEVNVSLAWLAQEDAYEATERLNTKGRLEFQLSWIQAPSATLGRLSSVSLVSSERPSMLSSNRLDRLEEHGSLLVHLTRGSELLAADKNGLSDPYVVAKLGKVTHKSKVIKKTLDPVWNETLVFDRQTLGSLLTSSMELHVYDKDGLMSFDDSLGKVLVPLETLRNSDREEISTNLSTKGRLQFTLEWLPTQTGTDSRNSGLRRKLFQVSSRGGSRSNIISRHDIMNLMATEASSPALFFAIKHWKQQHLAEWVLERAHRRCIRLRMMAAFRSWHGRKPSVLSEESSTLLREVGTLHINLTHATGLMGAGSSTPASPCVEFHLGRSHFTSKRMKKTHNPTWNEKFAFENVRLHDVCNSPLRVTVCDKHTLSYDVLGTASVSMRGLEIEDTRDFIQRVSNLGAIFFSVEWIPRTSRPRREYKPPPKKLVATKGGPTTKERVTRAMEVDSGRPSPTDLGRERGLLKVHLRRGSALRPPDINGAQSNPYVLVKLGNQTKKSRVINNTLNPVWDEVLEFRGHTIREYSKMKLRLHVTRKTGLFEDCISEVAVNLDQLISQEKLEYVEPLFIQGEIEFSVEWSPSPRRPQEQLLSRCMSCEKCFPKSKLEAKNLPGGFSEFYSTTPDSSKGASSAAPRQMSSRCNPCEKCDPRAHREDLKHASVAVDMASRLTERGVLRVLLESGTSLLAKDKNAKSDPYVIIRLGKVSKRSSVIKATLDPVWNETIEFNQLVLQDVLGKRLDLSVFDKDSILSRDDLLGEASVSLTQLREQSSFDCEQHLSKQGKLKFRVTWAPSGADKSRTATPTKIAWSAHRPGSSPPPPPPPLDKLPSPQRSTPRTGKGLILSPDVELKAPQKANADVYGNEIRESVKEAYERTQMLRELTAQLQTYIYSAKEDAAAVTVQRALREKQWKGSSSTTPGPPGLLRSNSLSLREYERETRKATERQRALVRFLSKQERKRVGKVEAAFLRFKASREKKRLNAIIIQRAYRVHLASMKLKRAHRAEFEATGVQRGAGAWKDDEVEGKVSFLQAQLRGRKARLAYSRQKESSKALKEFQEREMQYKETMAAARVQSLLRGKQARDALQKEEAAAVRLQALVRGRSARKSISKHREAVVQVQSLARAKKARGIRREASNAALTVQSIFRGKKEREKRQKEEEAAKRVQRIMRSKSARTTAEQLEDEERLAATRERVALAAAQEAQEAQERELERVRADAAQRMQAKFRGIKGREVADDVATRKAKIKTMTLQVAARKVQKRWRERVEEMKQIEALIEGSKQKKKSRRLALNQAVELKLNGNSLLYRRGGKDKLIDLASATSVSASHGRTGWKLVMRGEPGQQVFFHEFTADSNGSRDAWVKACNERIRKIQRQKLTDAVAAAAAAASSTRPPVFNNAQI